MNKALLTGKAFFDLTELLKILNAFYITGRESFEIPGKSQYLSLL